MLTLTVLCSAQFTRRQGQTAFPWRCPGTLHQHAPRHKVRRQPERWRSRVANPRHNDEKKRDSEGTGSWEEESSGDADQPIPDADPGADSNWAKAQSFAVLLGAATLSAVLTIQLSGKADLPDLAYQKLPGSVQGALPQAPLDKNQFSLPQFDLRAAVQGFKDGGDKQKAALNLPFSEQANKPKGSLNLPFERSAKGSDDRQKTQDKVKAERQQKFDESQQKKGAKTEQSRKDRQQRMKQKEQEKEAQNRQREKEKQEADRKEKERKEKERKENEKKKKFRDQALVGGSIFGVSALTFGKWQLVASLGAVVFRTVGGPTILSSVLRTPGYIIGRGMRVVEWDVSESPSGPTGDLVSMKLRALTPDGIRIAIAKEYGLSNYREVRQVSHWVTTTTPYFFEPMRTAATFKMLPDPAFVVWSKQPPSGPHKLPTRSQQPQPADSGSQDPLDGLTTDQVVAVMLKAISGVAAASRRQLSPADRIAAQLSNSSSGGSSSSDDSSSSSRSRSSSASSNGAAHSSNGTQQPADAHAATYNGNGSAQAARQNEFTSREHNTDTASGSQQHHHDYQQQRQQRWQQQQQQQQHDGQQSASAVVSRQQLSQQSSKFESNNGSPQHAAGAHQRQHQHAHSQQASDSTNGTGQESESGETSRQQSSSSSEASPQTGSALKDPFESRDDEVAGALQSADQAKTQSKDDETAGSIQIEDHSKSQSRDSSADNPLHWDDSRVLRCLCDSSSVSAESWGENLQLPSSFQKISDEQEERLVMAACKANGKMLPLFHAYAPHNIMTFVRFARLYCSEV